jgi:hypothetical protein
MERHRIKKDCSKFWYIVCMEGSISISFGIITFKMYLGMWEGLPFSCTLDLEITLSLTSLLQLYLYSPERNPGKQPSHQHWNIASKSAIQIGGQVW